MDADFGKGLGLASVGGAQNLHEGLGKAVLSVLETLPSKGVYTLIVFLGKEIRLKVNKRGCFDLWKGYYAYTGSALGDGAANLRRRVARHLRKRKVKHWHIDFLLANESARVVGVVAAEGDVNRECQINSAIKNIEGVIVPVVGFGASNCRQNCRSHLVYCGEEDIKEKIINAYTHLLGTETVWSFSGNL